MVISKYVIIKLLIIGRWLCCSRKQDLGGAHNLGTRLNTSPLLKTENCPHSTLYFTLRFVCVCGKAWVGSTKLTLISMQEKNEHKGAMCVILLF